MTRPPRVLFYVQHLLGIGHVKRASLLVRAWVRAGLEVQVVSGGEPVPKFGFAGARVIQLPPVRAADAAFSALVQADGRPLDEAFRQGRRAQLLKALKEAEPDFLVLENYPFGRRQLRWELLPLLEAAQGLRPRPCILSSVRDLLQARKPERVAETLALLERYFDGVLVHGDAEFIPLEASFPDAARIAPILHYTGYVTDDRAPPRGTVADEVLISAGGGAVGQALMLAALRARPLTSLRHCRWRFLLGPNLPPEAVAALRAQADGNVVLEPARSDFPQLLAHCRLSISQAGYNTVMDLLRAACPAVLVPFEGEGETEQLTRCERLQTVAGYPLVREGALTPETLAAAVELALKEGPRRTGLLREGAERSAELLQEWARKRFSAAHKGLCDE